MYSDSGKSIHAEGNDSPSSFDHLVSSAATPNALSLDVLSYAAALRSLYDCRFAPSGWWQHDGGEVEQKIGAG
jgi:hypothetical protein